MKFIELVQADGKKIVVNAFMVKVIMRSRMGDADCTRIELDGWSFLVKNKYEDLITALGAEGI